jgi:hypothetical protein
MNEHPSNLKKTRTSRYILMMAGPGICKRLKSQGIDSPEVVCAGIFEQSMGPRNQVGIGFSYRPARLQYIGWRNRFLGINFWAPLCWNFRTIYGDRYDKSGCGTGPPGCESIPGLLKRLQTRALYCKRCGGWYKEKREDYNIWVVLILSV